MRFLRNQDEGLIMAFAQVTDIATLTSRQAAIDAALVADCDAAKAEHPDIDFDDLLPSVIDPRSRGEKCAHGS